MLLSSLIGSRLLLILLLMNLPVLAMSSMVGNGNTETFMDILVIHDPLAPQSSIDDTNFIVANCYRLGVPIDNMNSSLFPTNISEALAQNGKPRFSVIIIDSESAYRMKPSQTEVILSLVIDYGVSLLAIGNKASTTYLEAIYKIDHEDCVSVMIDNKTLAIESSSLVSNWSNVLGDWRNIYPLYTSPQSMVNITTTLPAGLEEIADFQNGTSFSTGILAGKSGAGKTVFCAGEFSDFCYDTSFYHTYWEKTVNPLFARLILWLLPEDFARIVFNNEWYAVFRLDDVSSVSLFNLLPNKPNYYNLTGMAAIFDNLSISLDMGIIIDSWHGHGIDAATREWLLDQMRKGDSLWLHPNLVSSDYDHETQLSNLKLAKEWFIGNFSIAPLAFVAPEHKANDDTLKALYEEGIIVFSNLTCADDGMLSPPGAYEAIGTGRTWSDLVLDASFLSKIGTGTPITDLDLHNYFWATAFVSYTKEPLIVNLHPFSNAVDGVNRYIKWLKQYFPNFISTSLVDVAIKSMDRIPPYRAYWYMATVEQLFHQVVMTKLSFNGSSYNFDLSTTCSTGIAVVEIQSNVSDVQNVMVDGRDCPYYKNDACYIPLESLQENYAISIYTGEPDTPHLVFVSSIASEILWSSEQSMMGISINNLFQNFSAVIDVQAADFGKPEWIQVNGENVSSYHYDNGTHLLEITVDNQGHANIDIGWSSRLSTTNYLSPIVIGIGIGLAFLVVIFVIRKVRLRRKKMGRFKAKMNESRCSLRN